MTNLQLLLGERLKQNEPLASHTSFGIGGPADYFVRVFDREELKKTVVEARAQGIPFFILGSGTNVLFSDRGFRGLVIENRCDTIEIKDNILRVGSGVFLSKVVSAAAQNGLSGLEFAMGIPGTVGGAIHGNAGAFGSCVGDVVESVEILGLDGRCRRLSGSSLDFSYRRSLIQKSGDIILSAAFQLVPGDSKKILSRIKEVVMERIRTQPLTRQSAGSIFRNPGEAAAGYLLEQAGAMGRSRGGAAVSALHANFIINTGHATAASVRDLIFELRQLVEHKFGIQLELEVELVGDWANDKKN